MNIYTKQQWEEGERLVGEYLRQKYSHARIEYHREENIGAIVAHVNISKVKFYMYYLMQGTIIEE